MSLLPPPPRFSLGALAMAVASPFLAWLIVEVTVPPNNCGMFNLDCLFYMVITAAIGWGGGIALGCVGRTRGESPSLSWSGITLNGIPLILIGVAFGLIFSR